jgi:hypothetical protein
MTSFREHSGSYQLAYEEGGRALDAQERAVNELRSRASVLIAAAAITTSFFGSRAVTGSQLTTASWCAVSAFVVVATAVLAVLWPWRAWEFSANASDLIATYVETPSPATLPEIHRDMALHRSASYACNARQLRRLHSIFAAGLIGLAAELAAWGVALSAQG